VFVFKTFGLYCIIFPSYNFFNSHKEFIFLKTELTSQNLAHELLKVS